MPGGGPKYEPRQDEAPEASQWVLESRMQRIDEIVALRTRNLVVVLDRLEDNFNMAAVLRTCEGLGIQEVHVVENPAEPFRPNGAVTQGCDKWLDIARYPDFAACRAELKRRGFALWASAARDGAVSLHEVRFDKKVAIVFGNERYGVSDDVLNGVDGTFWIPMRGFTQSFNISVAAACTLSHAVHWRTQHLGQPGDLSPSEADALRTQFQELSVKQRKRLFKVERP